MYRITITKFEKRSEEEIEEIEKEMACGRAFSMPDRPEHDDHFFERHYRETKVLSTELTDEEFMAVKKATLETM